MKYLRTRLEGAKYWGLGRSGFVLSALGEGGYINPLEGSRAPGVDAVRITDRFYLGEPQFRGFDIRGVGPRVQRTFYSDASPAQTLLTGKDQITDDALGGRAYYLGRIELEIPLGAGARELGLRPSIYVQAGSLWNITKPNPTVDICATGETLSCIPQLTDATTGNTYFGNILTQQFNSAGQALYTYTTTDSTTNTPSVLTTICATGTPDTTGACIGTIPQPDLHHRDHAVHRAVSGEHPQAAAVRSAFGSTGTRRSGRCASTGPRRC